MITVGLLLASTLAWADPPAPRFEFGKPPEKAVDWRVQAKGGLLATSGNSRSRNGSLSLTASRQGPESKISVEGTVAYGQSSILVPVLDVNGDVAALARQSQVTTNQWGTRGRYDRFLTVNNAAYLMAQLGADRIAGKRLVAGGQLGYSRQLLKTQVHTAVAELGYDVSFERYVDPASDSASIHSARVYLGELAKLTDDTGINVSAEALFNLNREHAPDASDPDGLRTEVAALHDTRIVGKVGITTTLWKRLGFGFGVTLAYDQNPAPRPLPKSAGAAKYAPGFHPFSDHLDTLTEATLVFTFL